MNLEKERFYVDVPPSEIFEDVETPWINIESFDTKEEAIAFAMKYFGADENGMICIISKS